MKRSSTFTSMSLFLSASIFSACGISACGVNGRVSRASIGCNEQTEAQATEVTLKQFATSINGPFVQSDPLNIEFASRVLASGLKLVTLHDGLTDGQASTYLVRVSFFLKGQETEIAAKGTLTVPNPREFRASPPTLTNLQNQSPDKSPYTIEAICLSAKCTTIAVRLLEPYDPNVPNPGAIAVVSTQNQAAPANASKAQVDAAAVDGVKPATAAKIKLAGDDNAVSYADNQAGAGTKVTASKKQVVALFRDANKLAAEESAKRQAQQTHQRGRDNQRLQSTGTMTNPGSSSDNTTDGSTAQPNLTPATGVTVNDPAAIVDYILRWISSPQGTTDAGFSIALGVAAEESRRMQVQQASQPPFAPEDFPSKQPVTPQSGVPQAPPPTAGQVPGQGLAPAPAPGSAQNNAQLNGQANAQVGNQNQAAPTTAPAGAPMIAPVGGAAPQPGVNTPGADDVGVVDASGQPITNQAQPTGSAPIPQAPAQISPNTVGGAGQG